MEKKVIAEIRVSSSSQVVREGILPGGVTKVQKVMYHDSSAEAMEYRFQKLRDFYMALERQTVLDLGFSLEIYMYWKDGH